MGNINNLKPRWRPGQSGNPSGKAKLPDNLRSIHSLTQLEVCKLVSKYARMTRDQLQASIQDGATPMLEIAIASIFAQSAKHGDFTRLAFLLDRAIGKAPTVIETAEDTSVRGELKMLSTDELLRLVQAKVSE